MEYRGNKVNIEVSTGVEIGSEKNTKETSAALILSLLNSLISSTNITIVNIEMSKIGKALRRIFFVLLTMLLCVYIDIITHNLGTVLG